MPRGILCGLFLSTLTTLSSMAWAAEADGSDSPEAEGPSFTSELLVSWEYRQWLVDGETHGRHQPNFRWDLLYRLNGFEPLSPLVGLVVEGAGIESEEYHATDQLFGVLLGVGQETFRVITSGGYLNNHLFRIELIEKDPEIGEALYAYKESPNAHCAFWESSVRVSLGDFGLQGSYLKEWPLYGERTPGEGWSQDWRAAGHLSWKIIAAGYEYQSRPADQERIYSLSLLLPYWP